MHSVLIIIYFGLAPLQLSCGTIKQYVLRANNWYKWSNMSLLTGLQWLLKQIIISGFFLANILLHRICWIKWNSIEIDHWKFFCFLLELTLLPTWKIESMIKWKINLRSKVESSGQYKKESLKNISKKKYILIFLIKWLKSLSLEFIYITLRSQVL